MAAAHGGVEIVWVVVGLSDSCLEGVLARIPYKALSVIAPATLSEAALPPTPREAKTWSATNLTMEGSAAYSSNPNLSPKSQHKRGSSRFTPGGSNSTDGVVSSSYHDQPTTSTSNDLNVDDPHSSSGFRRGVTSEHTQPSHFVYEDIGLSLVYECMRKAMQCNCGGLVLLPRGSWRGRWSGLSASVGSPPLGNPVRNVSATLSNFGADDAVDGLDC